MIEWWDGNMIQRLSSSISDLRYRLGYKLKCDQMRWPYRGKWEEFDIWSLGGIFNVMSTTCHWMHRRSAVEFLPFSTVSRWAGNRGSAVRGDLYLLTFEVMSVEEEGAWKHDLARVPFGRADELTDGRTNERYELRTTDVAKWEKNIKT